MSHKCTAGFILNGRDPCKVCGSKPQDGCGRDGGAWADLRAQLAERDATIERLTGAMEGYKASDWKNYGALLASEARCAALERQVKAMQSVVVERFPAGAIHNGRVFDERGEADDFRKCFDHLAAWAEEVQAALSQPTQEGE